MDPPFTYDAANALRHPQLVAGEEERLQVVHSDRSFSPPSPRMACVLVWSSALFGVYPEVGLVQPSQACRLGWTAGLEGLCKVWARQGQEGMGWWSGVTVRTMVGGRGRVGWETRGPPGSC